MTILLEHSMLPEQGTVELDIHRTFEIKVTAEQARRKVNRWLFMEVGNMLRAEPPTLVVSNCIVWRVPVILTATHVGRVGIVGDIDVESSVMNTTAERMAEIEARAVVLGQHLPPYVPRLTVPTEFFPKDLRPTHPKPSRRQLPTLGIKTASWVTSTSLG